MTRKKAHAPILSPSFRWTPAADHLTASGLDSFRRRQRERMRAAQQKPEPPANVRPIQRTKEKTA